MFVGVWVGLLGERCWIGPCGRLMEEFSEGPKGCKVDLLVVDFSF